MHVVFKAVLLEGGQVLVSFHRSTGVSSCFLELTHEPLGPEAQADIPFLI